MSAEPAEPAAATEPAPRRLLAGYRDLLGAPGFRRIAAAALASKLPAGMVPLSLLLLIGREYSYGVAGLAVSSLAVGEGLTAPLRGRLADRRSPRVVLPVCLAGYLTAGALLLLAVAHGVSAVAICCLTAVVGATVPPVGIMMRSVWFASAGARTLPTAMALDTTLTNAALITGPVLTGWLSLSVSGFAPFAAIAALMAGAVGVLTGFPLAPRPARPGHRAAGPLASAPLRRLMAAHGLFVVAITVVDVVLPLHAQASGAAGYAGLYLGAMSVGSILGSLALGAAPALLSRGPRISVLLCAFAAGAGLLALAARLSPLTVLLVCPVAGAVVGSAFGTLYTLAGDLAPEGRVTETMAWLSSLNQAGGAVGAAAGAHVAAAQGGGTALLLVPAVALLAAAIGWKTKPDPSAKEKNAP
ncbi:MFS transporter [Streptomyces hiroshimensis]|uniref:MFS transporter n=1 Tax=Streptomyces hiroshimensis TaxID=66424 RepID=A0ABQ2YLA4_9ACTN|nr:MFS transporter [Streptomyces hiroshimensis]GGX88140.1 MFS transporter [Streptomyces hiroshimensis]